MQQKYELGTRSIYFWNKNEKKLSLHFIFALEPILFWHTCPHMPMPTHTLAIKIFFTYKFNRICGGSQLLVAGSQGLIPRVPGVRVPCPRVVGSQVMGLGSQDPGFHASDPDFRLCCSHWENLLNVINQI